MKKYLLLFTIISPLLFMSCENNGGEMSDDELIEAIINAENRISVTKNDLPKSAIANLDFNMPNDIVGYAELAPELGYEIEMKSWDFIDFELDYERDDNQYFATNGRKLDMKILRPSPQQEVLYVSAFQFGGGIKKKHSSILEFEVNFLSRSLFE